VDLLARRRPRAPRLLATALLAAALSGCALFGKHEDVGSRAGAPGTDAPTTTPPASGKTSGAAEGRTTERTAVAAPGERRAPAREDPGAGSPRREASQRLVEEGKGYAVAGQDAAARDRFESALRLDGSNGEAYFQLARLAADDGDWSDAAGYQAKAEALLRGTPGWDAALDELAGRIAERR
jgi:hypothetical protein